MIAEAPLSFAPGACNGSRPRRAPLARGRRRSEAAVLAELTGPLLADLGRVFGAGEGRATVLSGGASAGRRAALGLALRPGDRVIVARHGQLGADWAATASALGLVVETIDAPWGAPAPIAAIARRLGDDVEGRIRAVVAVHVETSTGAVSDLAGLRAVIDAAYHDALLIADASGAFGAMPFDAAGWGVDIALAGGAGGLTTRPGLALLALSARGIEAGLRTKPRRGPRLAAMLAASAYATPERLLWDLRAGLDRFLDEGPGRVYSRHRRIAEGVRRAAAAWGLDRLAHGASADTITALRMPPGVDAQVVLRRARERYGARFGGVAGPLAGDVVRIGHAGDLDDATMLAGVASAEMALLDAGARFEPGVGLAAALRWFRASAPVPAFATAAE